MKTGLKPFLIAAFGLLFISFVINVTALPYLSFDMRYGVPYFVVEVLMILEYFVGVAGFFLFLSLFIFSSQARAYGVQVVASCFVALSGLLSFVEGLVHMNMPYEQTFSEYVIFLSVVFASSFLRTIFAVFMLKAGRSDIRTTVFFYAVAEAVFLGFLITNFITFERVSGGISHEVAVCCSLLARVITISVFLFKAPNGSETEHIVTYT
ncbi:MAG: hypothetical protein KAS23_00395 [Anaerohalosphaera sp.]|nr:hypothetical protein [Anaerohalosphaera sp.]